MDVSAHSRVLADKIEASVTERVGHWIVVIVTTAVLSGGHSVNDIRHTPAVSAFLISLQFPRFSLSRFSSGFWGVSFRFLVFVYCRLDFPGGFSPGSFPLGVPKVQRNGAKGRKPDRFRQELSNESNQIAIPTSINIV